MSENNFKDKIFVVSGATSGIGKHLCERLVSSGAIVLGIGRDASKISDLLARYAGLEFESMDINDQTGIEEVLNRFVSKRGRIDGMVLCAGREETIPLSIYGSDKLNSLFNVNVFSGVEFLRVFSKKKNSNDGASVVFISSVMGELGQPGKIGYSATKAAILGVVRSAALELARRKIRVNAISPGIVNTPLTEQLFGQLSEENISEINKMHPLGLGEVEDVIPMITFLLSWDSRWMTGQNIIIDGGYSIH